ncbi:MAG: hypothetical protein LC776_06975 [Acidobacteria bacterium]|nr:hypothetical protein [Acidobacteriota bacterium]
MRYVIGYALAVVVVADAARLVWELLQPLLSVLAGQVQHKARKRLLEELRALDMEARCEVWSA